LQKHIDSKDAKEKQLTKENNQMKEQLWSDDNSLKKEAATLNQ